MTDSYEIGLTQATMANLATLPMRSPKTDYRPYARVVDLADGSQRGMGYPVAEWHWDSLPQEQRDRLRTFCPGASANVFIRTRITDSQDSYKVFSAVMLWPVEGEDREFFYRKDFNIRFRKLIEVAP